MNALVAVTKGMWAVKLCSNKIPHFLTGSADWHRLVVVVVLVASVMFVLESRTAHAKFSNANWSLLNLCRRACKTAALG